MSKPVKTKYFDCSTQENKKKVVMLKLKMEEAIMGVVGKENYKISDEALEMMSIVALKCNYK